jgi:hypothetical protein
MRCATFITIIYLFIVWKTKRLSITPTNDTADENNDDGNNNNNRSGGGGGNEDLWASVVTRNRGDERTDVRRRARRDNDFTAADDHRLSHFTRQWPDQGKRQLELVCPDRILI